MAGTPHVASNDVPQANRPDRVGHLVVAVVRTGTCDPEALGLDRRDLNYYSHAATLLGFLDADGKPTPSGEALAAMREEPRMARIAQAFAESRVARAWMSWANESHIANLRPGSAEDFLKAASDLAESTAKRRATTLRRWWDTLVDYLQPQGPAQGTLGLPEPIAHPPTPELDAEVRRIFATLVAEVPLSELPDLRKQVQEHVARFRQAAKHDDFLPVDVAEALGEALEELLVDCPINTPQERAWIVGAARYFVSDADAQPDMEGQLGLDDDLAVFNWVAWQLNRQDLLIDL